MIRVGFLLAAVAALSTLSAEAARVDIAVTSNIYTPVTVTIIEGDSARFTNHGGDHNAQADDLSWRCAQGCDDTGGNGNASSSNWSFERFFNEPGTYRYHCVVHGGVNGLGMSGIIRVLAFEIFSDGFDTGDTTVWDLTFP